MTPRLSLLACSYLIVRLCTNAAAQSEIISDKDTRIGMAGTLAIEDGPSRFGARAELTAAGRVRLLAGLAHAEVPDFRLSLLPISPTRGSGDTGLMAHIGSHGEFIESESIGLLASGGGISRNVGTGYRSYLYPQIRHARYRHRTERGAPLSLNEYKL